MPSNEGDRLAVVIVTFNSADVITACLDSLIGTAAERLDIIVVDNASTDDTVETIRAWAERAAVALAEHQAGRSDGQTARVHLVHSGRNGGYAFGVNTGIRFAQAHFSAAGYWVLNPDCVVPPATPDVYLARLASGPAGLIGGRCLLLEQPKQIQTDGGRVNKRTGVCSSINAGQAVASARQDGLTPDFVSGANFVASTEFVNAIGLMDEHYFLYYEEVDWAFRRGDQPMEVNTDALVFHKGGSSIGSPTIHRAASAFSNYFNHRSRIRFVRRFSPSALPVAYAWTVAKAVQTRIKDGPDAAASILAGAFGLAPPRSIRARVEALALDD